jgi:hypothetical protein
LQVEQQSLMAALVRFRVVVGAFESVDRVVWADAAIAKIGIAAEQDLPVVGNIYEPTHLRDETAKVIKAVERYNTARTATPQNDALSLGLSVSL